MAFRRLVCFSLLCSLGVQFSQCLSLFIFSPIVGGLRYCYCLWSHDISSAALANSTVLDCGPETRATVHAPLRTSTWHSVPQMGRAERTTPFGASLGRTTAAAAAATAGSPMRRGLRMGAVWVRSSSQA